MDAVDLPSEVLFCIFSWLDPKDFDAYGLISKSWLQMSRENELWRHLCFKKWQKNPNNSQLSINPLIPVLEGTSVIDWKQAFTLRTLADVALENFHTLATTSNFVHLIGHEYFDEGWINFDKFTALFNRIVSLPPRLVTPDRAQHYLNIYSFLTEYELLMLKQLNSSVFSDFSYVGEFLKIHHRRIGSFDAIASMLAKNVISLRQVALKKKIPIEVLGHQLNLRGKYFFDSQHCQKAYRPFVDFLSTAILILDDWTKSDAFQSYIAEDYVNESEPVNGLFWTLEAFAGWMSIDEFMNFIPGINSVSQITRIYMAAAVVAQDQDNSRIMLGITVKTFFETYYPWLFGDFKKDIQLLVPTFDTLGTVFSGLKKAFNLFNIKDPNTEPTLKAIMQGNAKFLESFLIQILNALDVSHTRLRISVLDSLMEFCELFDESSFEPLLEPLFDKLYWLLNTKNSVLSIKVMSTIICIFSMCPGSFHKHKDRVMAELNKLLTYTDAKEQEKVIEITYQLSVKMGSEMTDQLKPIYDQTIQAFKNNPSANEDRILTLSVFAIRGLKNEFKEHLPIVVPVIYENRALELFRIGPFKTKEFDKYSFAKRKAALESAVNLIEHLDREYILPYYEQLGDIISANIDVSGSMKLLPVACKGLAYYVNKFITLETTQTPQWTARVYQLIEDKLVPYAALMHKLVNLREWFDMVLVYFDIMEYLCTINPLVHPLHNDKHMRLSIDVIISSLQKLHESDEKQYSETVFSFFQLVLDHSLNAETFFNNFWKPILEPQILGLLHPSRKPFPLSIWIVNEVIERCGSRITNFDLERYSCWH